MSRPYLFRDVLEKGKRISSEDGHHIYCDGNNHYHLYPNLDMKVKEGCPCQTLRDHPLDSFHRPLRVDYKTEARPRYEVYNKDADFFHDHLTGGMIWLKESSRGDGGVTWIEQLVEQILTLLNREEHGTVLLQDRSQPPQEGATP